MSRCLWAVLVMFVLPAPAIAHISMKPKKAPAGTVARLTIQVENERDHARTQRVDIKLPPGLGDVSVRGAPGWKARIVGAAGDADRVILTARSEGARIGPGEVHRDFRLSARLPISPGARLPFKTLQTYDNGEVVRWIGPPSSEEPAAYLRLTAAKDEPKAATGPEGATGDRGVVTDEGGQAQPADDGDDDGDGGDTAKIAAVVAAVVAALIGAVVLLRRRRRAA